MRCGKLRAGIIEADRRHDTADGHVQRNPAAAPTTRRPMRCGTSAHVDSLVSALRTPHYNVGK